MIDPNFYGIPKKVWLSRWDFKPGWSRRPYPHTHTHTQQTRDLREGVLGGEAPYWKDTGTLMRPAEWVSSRMAAMTAWRSSVLLLTSTGGMSCSMHACLLEMR